MEQDEKGLGWSGQISLDARPSPSGAMAAESAYHQRNEVADICQCLLDSGLEARDTGPSEEPRV